MDAELIGGPPSVAVRMDVDLQFLLLLINDYVIPFKANSFSVLDIWCDKNCAVLVFHFYRVHDL